MVTYAVSKANYAELWGLSTDTKPTGIGAVPNGSLFTEIDTGSTYRFNGDAGDWFDATQKYPKKLEVASGKYKVTYSDNTTKTAGIVVVLEGDKATYTENGMKVSCNAIQVTVAIVIASKSTEYTGEEITLSAYDDTLTSPDTPYSVTASNNTIFDTATDIIPKYETKEITETDVGEYAFGMTANDFSTDNDQCIVTFSVTDGGLTIVEAEPEPAQEPGEE